MPKIGVKLEKIAVILGPAFFTPMFQNNIEPTPPHITTKAKDIYPKLSSGCLLYTSKKINIATASYDSVAKRFKEVAKEVPDANYFTFSDAAVNATCENIMRHMEIFGLKNKL